MELKYLDKFKCYRILSDSRGPPPGGGRWVDGGGGGYGLWGVPCMHAHTCMHMHMHMHAHMHMHVKHAKDAKHGCLHVSGHLQFLYMYKCACVHVHACVWGHPPCPHTCPLPRATGSPKHQNSISLELIEIIIIIIIIIINNLFSLFYKVSLSLFFYDTVIIRE